MMKKRGELARQDMESLMAQPAFHRFLFTVFSSAPMFSGAYGTDGRHLTLAEGRRSLGFDILRSAELIRPDALLTIMSAEMTAQKEYQDEPRNDRDEDLDGPRQRDIARGVEHLEYPATPDSD